MATLHIEHAITDFPTWKAAFDRFASKRTEMGATAQRISLLHDDPTYLVLQLDFPTVAQAEAFKDFLETRVWSTPANSPGLAATPRARVLEAAPAQ
jgi:hypothetical protein